MMPVVRTPLSAAERVAEVVDMLEEVRFVLRVAGRESSDLGLLQAGDTILGVQDLLGRWLESERDAMPGAGS